MKKLFPGSIRRPAASAVPRAERPFAVRPEVSEISGWPFDETARRIVAEHLALGCRGFAVAGVSAGTGVSYVAAGLGLALARAGVNTLLMDTDLRAAGLQTYFPNAPAQQGLADLLADSSLDVMDVVTQPAPNLSVLPAGAPITPASDVLDGHRFRMIAEQCVRSFDCAIFDTPPANRSSDGRRVSSVVGYSLIVARRSHTFAQDVEYLAKAIGEDGGIVIGAILNGV